MRKVPKVQITKEVNLDLIDDRLSKKELQTGQDRVLMQEQVDVTSTDILKWIRPWKWQPLANTRQLSVTIN